MNTNYIKIHPQATVVKRGNQGMSCKKEDSVQKGTMLEIEYPLSVSSLVPL
mgnify:CR=1 FL=1